MSGPPPSPKASPPPPPPPGYTSPPPEKLPFTNPLYGRKQTSPPKRRKSNKVAKQIAAHSDGDIEMGQYGNSKSTNAQEESFQEEEGQTEDKKAGPHFVYKRHNVELGPDTFQMFPLPEIKWIKDARSNRAFNCVLASLLFGMVGFVLMLIWFYLGTGRSVTAVGLVHNTVPLVIRSEGCDVQFKRIPPINNAEAFNGSVPNYPQGCLDLKPTQPSDDNTGYSCSDWWGAPPPNILEATLRLFFRYGVGNDCTHQLTKTFDSNNQIFGLNHYCIDYSYHLPMISFVQNIPDNDGSYVRMSADYVNPYDISNGRKVLKQEVSWWKGPNPLPNSTVQVTGKEAVGSVSPCSITVWVYNPLSSVTIVATKSNPPIKIKKHEEKTEGVMDGESLRPRWELEINRLAINATTAEVKMNNLKVKDIDVRLESGHIDIKGLHMLPKDIPEEMKETNASSRLKTGVDLGARDKPGILIPTNKSQCDTGEKECGGTVRVSMLSSTRFIYSQNEGVVCAASHAVALEANDCEAPNVTQSNSSNTSKISDQPLSGTCKGRVLMCNAADDNCKYGDTESVRLLSVQALKGGVYFSAVDYNATRDNMYNVRKTISGKRCKFPFRDAASNRIHWDCTTEGQGERAWCQIDERDLSKPSNGSCSSNMYMNGPSNCTANSTFADEEGWGFCSPYQTFQGFAYKSEQLRFDRVGTTNLKYIKGFENAEKNSPVLVRLNMKSKSSALGESLWVYVTRTPYILIRNDRLSMFSGSLISARQGPVKFMRLSPGYCPVESLPDATLSGAQMGAVHDAIVERADGAPTSVLSWLGEYSGDVAERASGIKWDPNYLDPKTWTPIGLTLYNRQGDGTYQIKPVSSLPGNREAGATVYFTFILIAFYLTLSFFLVVPSLRRVLIHRYNAFLRERRKLSLTEGQVRLEKNIKRRTKELGEDDGDDPMEEDSKQFWNVVDKTAGEKEMRAISYFEPALEDLRKQIKKLSGNELKKAKIHRKISMGHIGVNAEDDDGEDDDVIESDCPTKCRYLCDRILSTFCHCCCVRGSIRKMGRKMSKLEKLHSQFARINAIRSKYRTSIETYTAFFTNAPDHWKDSPKSRGLMSGVFGMFNNDPEREKEKQDEKDRNENHSRTILQIFPSIDPTRTDPVGENQFLKFWVDAEEQFGDEIVKNRQGYVKDYASAKVIIDLVNKAYCKIDDKVIVKINKCLELCDKVWLLRERETADYVEPLNFWEIADVGYHLFVAPYFKNSIRNFLEDEILDERKVKNEWYSKQNILVQYGLAVFYLLECYGSNRKFLQYKYIPVVADTGAGEDDILDDGDDSEEGSDDEEESDASSSYGDSDSDSDESSVEDEEENSQKKKKKESFLLIHSLPCLPMKTWNLGNQKRLQQHVAEIRKAGSIKLNILVDRYNTYCDSKGLVKVETDELISTLREDYEFSYDIKSKSFQNVKFEPSEGRETQSSDPWPNLRFAGACIAFLLTTLNFLPLAIFYVCVKFRGYGVSFVLLILREIFIIIPSVLLTAVMFATVDPYTQFAEPGRIFTFKEMIHTPYRFFEIPDHFYNIEFCMMINYIFFAVGNIDLLLYYLHGDIQLFGRGENAGCFKKGEWVIIKKGKTNKGALGTFLMFMKLLCQCRKKVSNDSADKKSKSKIFKIQDVNITRDGKVKNYVVVEANRTDFFPCVSASEEDSQTQTHVYKKLQAVQPPQLVNWFHALVHFLFLVLLNFILSLVVAYVGMVLSWWVLGAIIQPERTLAFASTVLVMVGAIKAMFSDFDKQRDKLMKKLEHCVSDFIATLLQQSQQIAGAGKEKLAKAMPKLPPVFAGVDMTATEIFKALQTEKGQLVLCMKAIDNAIVMKLGNEGLKDPRVAYLKDFVACAAQSERDDQLVAFRALAIKVVVNHCCGPETDKKKVNVVVLLAGACFASDSLNARDTIGKLGHAIVPLVRPGNNPHMASFVRFTTWFMKICADDMKTFTATKDKLVSFLQTAMTALNKPPEVKKSSRTKEQSSTGATGLKMPSRVSFGLEDVLVACLMFVSFNSIKNMLMVEAFKLKNKVSKKFRRGSAVIMNSVKNLFTIDILYSCDEQFSKLIKLLVASKGKQTKQILVCQEKIINIIIDQLLAVIGVNAGTKEEKETKEKYRPVIAKLLKICGLSWNRVFNSNTPSKKPKDNKGVSTMVDEATDLIKSVMRIAPIDQFNPTTRAVSLVPGETGKLTRALLNQIKKDEKEEDEKEGDEEDADLRRMRKMKRLLHYFVNSLLIFEDQTKGTSGIPPIRKILFSSDKSNAFVNDARKKMIAGRPSEIVWDGPNGGIQIIKAEYTQRAIAFLKQALQAYCPQIAAKLPRGQPKSAGSAPEKEAMDGKKSKMTRAIELAKLASKLPASKEKLPKKLTVMVEQLVDIIFDDNPEMKGKAMQIIDGGKKVMAVVEKSRTSKTMKSKSVSKEEKYKTMFKQVDTSGDGEVDFGEFVALCNENLKLNLSTQRCKALFAKSDSNGSGTLNMKEFEKCMKLLEKEITKASLAKIGLTEATMYPAIAGILIWLLCILIFVLMGFSAFTEGTAFGAGIGGVMPLLAGKSAGLKDMISKINVNELVEKTLKEDFQNES
jgi:hypothetical protein